MTGDNLKAVAKKLFPSGLLTQFDPFWDDLIVSYKINNPSRGSVFLSQVGVECAYFRVFSENLNYSAQGLANMWPNRYSVSTKKPYKPNSIALEIQYKPEIIANKTYANRYGNGPESSGDGWRFRGRGLKQLTFFDNYRDFGRSIKMEKEILQNPDLLLTPKYAMKSAGWFWNTRNLSPLADRVKPGTKKPDEFIVITKRITGSDTLIDKRWGLYNKAILLF